MAKHFKLRISKVIPSFHFCRSKNAYRLPISPVPLSVYRLSPLNRKSSDTAYHSFPNPPPSTPISSSEEGPEKRLVSGMVDVGCGGRKARGFHSESCVDSPEWFRRRSHGGGESNDGDVSSTSPLVTKKRVGKRKGPAKGASLNVVVRNRISSSSGEGGWFSSDEGETLETSINFSNESSIEHDDSKSLIATSTITSDKNRAVALKSLKRRMSNIRSVKPRQRVTTSADKATNFHPKTAMQSIAVEKRSDDPFGDFRRSMMEMILEKQMFEMRDLEELLLCFLTLNSRHHHKVIVEAFTEIWEALFSKSPLNRCLVAEKVV